MLTESMALYVVGSLALILIGILGLVMRSIINGHLLPRNTVIEMRERDAERISAQAETLAVLQPAVLEITSTQQSLSASFTDLANAAALQVKLAEIIHKTVENSNDNGQ